MLDGGWFVASISFPVIPFALRVGARRRGGSIRVMQYGDVARLDDTPGDSLVVAEPRCIAGDGHLPFLLSNHHRDDDFA
jgi:hypothetical protein